MIDAPTEKKPKTAMFKNSSTFGKKDDDANNTIPSSDEAHDGDDKKAKGLGVVSFESDSENGTVSKVEYCSVCIHLFVCSIVYVFSNITTYTILLYFVVSKINESNRKNELLSLVQKMVESLA